MYFIYIQTIIFFSYVILILYNDILQTFSFIRFIYMYIGFVYLKITTYLRVITTTTTNDMCLLAKEAIQMCDRYLTTLPSTIIQ